MNYQLIKIGRSGDNDIKLSHASVSRHHAEIFVDADGNIFVRDLKSSNGTFINDVKIEGGNELKPGDVLRVGVEDIVDWQRMIRPVVGESRKITGDQAPTEKSKSQKRQLVLVFSILAVLLVGVAFFAIEKFTASKDKVNGTTSTDEPAVKEVTLAFLEKASIEQLEECKNSKVTDCKGDTTLVSLKERDVKIIVTKGVYFTYVSKVNGGSEPNEAPKGKKDNADEPKDNGGGSNKGGDNKGGDKKGGENKDGDKTKKTEKKDSKDKKSTGNRMYTWKKGDDIDRVASSFSTNDCKVTAESILEDNGKNSESEIQPGDKLTIKCHN